MTLAQLAQAAGIEIAGNAAVPVTGFEEFVRRGATQ